MKDLESKASLYAHFVAFLEFPLSGKVGKGILFFIRN